MEMEMEMEIEESFSNLSLAADLGTCAKRRKLSESSWVVSKTHNDCFRVTFPNKQARRRTGRVAVNPSAIVSTVSAFGVF